MPLELPGFYFDSAKNRYFPIASRPPPQPVFIPPPSLTQTRLSHDACNLQILNTFPVTARACRRALNQAMLYRLSRAALLSTKPAPIGASITALCVTANRQYVGDSTGSVYSSHHSEDDDEENWLPFWHLLERGISDIVSIAAAKSRIAIIASGSTCKIVIAPEWVENTHEDVEVGFELRPNTSLLRDVWASAFTGTSLSIGSHNKVVHMDDVDNNKTMRSLPTPSDALCLDRDQALLYAGLRNGGVYRFDTRDDGKGQPLFQNEKRTSITHLKTVRDWQMVVAQINGQVGCYDLRYLKSQEPVLILEGHCNSMRQKLGFAVDPAHNFLFLAGNDNRIRAWSLSDGKRCLSSTSDRGNEEGLFQKVFSSPVLSMQLSRATSAEPLLHLATREGLFRYRIGNVSL